MLCCSQTILREWGWAFFALFRLLLFLLVFAVSLSLCLYFSIVYSLQSSSAFCLHKHFSLCRIRFMHHIWPCSPFFQASDPKQPIVYIPSCGFRTMAMSCLWNLLWLWFRWMQFALKSWLFCLHTPTVFHHSKDACSISQLCVIRFCLHQIHFKVTTASIECSCFFVGSLYCLKDFTA